MRIILIYNGPMNLAIRDAEQLIQEHQLLMRAYGEAQARCSELLRSQAAELETLRSEAMRLRASVIVRDTARAWGRDDGPDRRTMPSDADDLAALEASLVAADLVICQTGCLSHGAYWRVEDHCKRTGKTCVLVDEPEAVRIMRIHALAG